MFENIAQSLLKSALDIFQAGGELRLPIELIFSENDLNILPVADIARLKQALERQGASAPLDAEGDIMSLREQFNRIAASVDYPYGWMDNAINDGYLRSLQPVFKDANVVALGVGTGRKDNRLFELLGKADRPHRVFYNDLYDVGAAINEVCHQRKLFPQSRIFPVQGDMRSNDKTWRSKNPAIKGLTRDGDILRFLREDRRRTVVTNYGASWNDLSFDDMAQTLDFFHDEFKPGTIFIIAIDNTQKESALRRAYDNPLHRQIWLTAYIAVAGELGIKIDPLKHRCEMRFIRTANDIKIQPTIICEEQYAVPLLPGKLTPHEIFFAVVNKIPFHHEHEQSAVTTPNLLATMFDKAQMEILARLPTPFFKPKGDVLTQAEINGTDYYIDGHEKDFKDFDYCHFMFMRKDSPPIKQLLHPAV